MMCMSATGQHLPPFMIFPRARLNEGMKKGAPAGTKFRCNTSGYMTTDVFLEWFDHFLEYTKPCQETPVLLIVDGHSSHTKNFAFVERAQRNFVTVLVLPPHCSNKMQPLDLTFMGPFKTHYANAVEVLLRQNPGRIIGIYDVAELMATAFTKTACTSVAISGFRTSGIWPCNRNVFTDESYAPSEVTDVVELQFAVKPDTKQSNPAIDNTTEAHNEQRPVNLSDSVLQSAFNIAPLDILPLPRCDKPRNTKRKRKNENCVEITTDNYRQELAAADATKEIKLIKKQRKPAKRTKPETLLDDTLCDICGLCFVDSNGGSGWSKCAKCGIRFHMDCYKRENLCNSCI